MLTQERLKEIFHYDPETGIFTWRVKISNCIEINDVAGHKAKDGYIHIHLSGKHYYAHRLAWLYVYGVWPASCIDHRDHIKSNNKFTNLRDANYSENAQNQIKATAQNKYSGLLGAHYEKDRNRYAATIKINGKTRYLGSFITAEQAHQAYLETKRKVHSTCTI